MAPRAGMTAIQHLLAPKAILAPRFLNRDGASVLVERLDQSTLVDLHNWYVDRDGGDDGHRLLHAAPFVDMCLAALEPPVLLHEASHALMAKRYGFPVSAITLHFLGGMTAVEGFQKVLEGLLDSETRRQAVDIGQPRHPGGTPAR